jgi:catechol 2,3-dioxygenase-like lactoylglutathione lyase family enzyme
MKERRNKEMLKTHIALNTGRFVESVEFYKAFLGLEPVKLKPGYAKFDVQDPPLNLTLNEAKVEAVGALNHLGIQVQSTEAVREAAGRLKAAGLATFEENDTDCCYALQDKIWVTDPNGYRWEVFVVKVGDTAPEVTVMSSVSTQACCAPSCCDGTGGEIR